jgi:hypothetical protein
MISSENYHSLSFLSRSLHQLPVTPPSWAPYDLSTMFSHTQFMLFPQSETPSFTFIHPMQLLYLMDGKLDLTSFSDMLRPWTRIHKRLNVSKLLTPRSFQYQRFTSFYASITIYKLGVLGCWGLEWSLDWVISHLLGSLGWGIGSSAFV